MSTDAELLQRYVNDHDEPAFAELVRRHLDLVYSAAFRRTNGQHQLAEEIAQKVFTDLARKAGALRNHPTLTGWLHRSTRYAAIDTARSEIRRQKLAQTLTVMHDESSKPEPQTNWEHLRPVIDEALDQLKERDRELMLLRFFNGLTFAEVGEKLQLSENAARMRTERALDKLRSQLGKRGVTSTATALGLLLTNQSFAAAPAGLATAITNVALATGPASGIAGVITSILMSKLTTSVVTAIVAAGITAVICTSVAQDLDPDLAILRKENIRLARATAADANASSVAAIANEYASRASDLARALAQRQTKASDTATKPSEASNKAVTARGHSDHGTATPKETAMTFAYACDTCDPTVMAKLLYFDDQSREKALKVLATMPESIRSQYPTPEAFYGLCLAAACLEAPPPGADLMERFMVVVELSPERFATRRRGSDWNIHEYQKTPDGWKYILPPEALDNAPQNLCSTTLVKLSSP